MRGLKAKIGQTPRLTKLNQPMHKEYFYKVELTRDGLESYPAISKTHFENVVSTWRRYKKSIAFFRNHNVLCCLVWPLKVVAEKQVERLEKYLLRKYGISYYTIKHIEKRIWPKAEGA